MSSPTAQQRKEFGESMGLEGSELMEWVRVQQTFEREDKEYERKEKEREKKHLQREEEHLKRMKRLDVEQKEMEDK